MAERVFCDSGVLVRYFAEDDLPRALAALDLIESDATLVLSTGVLFEVVHTLRTQFGVSNPALGEGLISFLSRANVELSDADAGAVVAGIQSSLNLSARRIGDAILAAAAEQADCDWIATFDEAFASATIPSRLL